jgi:hypothetical protein
MMRTRFASVVAFESSSAHTGWRFPVRALMTTTGDRSRRLRARSRREGRRLRRNASGLSSPGTLTMSIEPGLNPSARFMSVGSIAAPAALRGMPSVGRFSRRPVSVLASRSVSASFGHGSRLDWAWAAVGMARAVSIAAASVAQRRLLILAGHPSCALFRPRHQLASAPSISPPPTEPTSGTRSPSSGAGPRSRRWSSSGQREPT